MRPNIVLIDFENVQPESLDLLKDGPFKVLVFVGAIILGMLILHAGLRRFGGRF